MEKLYRNEWEDVIHDVSLDAAKAYVKWVKNNSKTPPAEGLEESVYNKLNGFLKQKYPYDAIQNDDMETLKNFSSDDLWRWQVHGDSYDPRRKHEAEEMMKYLPFVQGIAPEGESWLDNRNDLKLKASELGFSYDQEGLSKFLNKLSKYQTVYDRGQLMKEMRESGLYWPMKLAYPSLMEGIENAVSTGGDLSKAQAVGLGLLDAGANAAMFGIPGASAAKVSSPVAAGVLDAVVQGGLEADRQGLKTVIDPTLEADPRQAIMASLFGSTRPAILGTAQAAVSKIPGKAAMEVSRGIGKATKAGDPLEIERETVKELVTNHNRIVQKTNDELMNMSIAQVQSRGLPLSEENIAAAMEYMKKSPLAGLRLERSVSETEKMLGTSRVNEMAKLLGVDAEKNGTYNVDAFLKAYDKKPVYTWNVNGPTATITTPTKRPVIKENPDGSYKVVQYGNDKLFYLSPENSVQYKALFPSKYADEAQASVWRGRGLKAGKVLAGIGGRFEPTFKLNPLNVGPQNFPEYRKQDWYTRLGPKSRAIIDEAFKKKMEEDEEQFYLDVE